MRKLKELFGKWDKRAKKLIAVSLVFVLFFGSVYAVQAGAETAGGAEQTPVSEAADAAVSEMPVEVVPEVPDAATSDVEEAPQSVSQPVAGDMDVQSNTEAAPAGEEGLPVANGDVPDGVAMAGGAGAPVAYGYTGPGTFVVFFIYDEKNEKAYSSGTLVPQPDLISKKHIPYKQDFLDSITPDGKEIQWVWKFSPGWKQGDPEPGTPFIFDYLHSWGGTTDIWLEAKFVTSYTRTATYYLNQDPNSTELRKDTYTLGDLVRDPKIFNKGQTLGVFGTFVCWVDGNGDEFEFDKPISSNIKLYGKWSTSKSYTINYYDKPGGTLQDTKTYDENDPVTDPGIFTVGEIKSGSKFLGWGYYPSGSSTLTDYAFGNKLTSDLDLYGRWEVQKYTVEVHHLSLEDNKPLAPFFMENNGNPITYTNVSGDTVDWVMKTFQTTPGYYNYTFHTFTKDGTGGPGSAQVPSDKVDLSSATPDASNKVIIYAWYSIQSGSHLVRFYDEIGGSPIETSVVLTGGTVAAPASRVPGSVYGTYGEFAWWQHYPGGTGAPAAKFDFSKPITGNVDVYAKWKKTYDLKVTHVDFYARALIDNMFITGGNGTTTTVDSTMTDWQVPVINNTFYDAIGYSFINPGYHGGYMEWTGFTGTKTIDFSQRRDFLTVNGTTDFYVHYKRNTTPAGIFYDDEDTASRTAAPHLMALPKTQGETFTAPAANTFTRTDYVISGWKVLSGGYSGAPNGTVYAPGADIKSSGQDMVFAAVWRNASYTITLKYLNLDGTPLTLADGTPVPDTTALADADGWEVKPVAVSEKKAMHYTFATTSGATKYGMDAKIDFLSNPPSELAAGKLTIYVYHASSIISVSIPGKINYYTTPLMNGVVESPVYSFKNLSELPVDASFTRLVTEPGKAYLDGKGYTIQDNGVSIVSNGASSAEKMPLEITLQGVTGSAFSGFSLPGAGAGPGLAPNTTIGESLGVLDGTKYSGGASSDIGQFRVGGKFYGPYPTEERNMQVGFVFHLDLAPVIP